MKIKRNNEIIFPGAKKGLINSYLSLREFMWKGGRRENETIKLLESSTGSGALLEVKAKSRVGFRTASFPLGQLGLISFQWLKGSEYMHDLTEVTAITGKNRNFTGYVKAVSFP